MTLRVINISRLLLLVAGLLGIASWPAAGAEVEITPSVGVSEEYTDNVFDSNVDVKEEWITRVIPGIAMRYRAPLWEWNTAYTFDYRHYALGRKGDETRHEGSIRGKVEMIREMLFMELSDVYKNVPLDIARDTTIESLTTNQSDQNVGMVTPYLILHPNKALTVVSGYRYTNIWYKDPTAIDKRSHNTFLRANHEVSQKLFVTADYSMTREDSPNYGFYRHEIYAGPRYEYADKSFLFAQGGGSFTYYDDRQETTSPTWNAGITHVFDTFVATASTGVKYSDDPIRGSVQETSYAASLQKDMVRGSANLYSSYTEYLDSLTDIKAIKRFSVGFTSNHELLPDSRGLLGFTYERYIDLRLNTYTNKYVVDTGLTYSFGHGLAGSLTYRFIEYSSPNSINDNKTVNRFIAEVRKSF